MDTIVKSERYIVRASDVGYGNENALIHIPASKVPVFLSKKKSQSLLSTHGVLGYFYRDMIDRGILGYENADGVHITGFYEKDCFKFDLMYAEVNMKFIKLPDATDYPLFPSKTKAVIWELEGFGKLSPLVNASKFVTHLNPMVESEQETLKVIFLSTLKNVGGQLIAVSLYITIDGPVLVAEKFDPHNKENTYAVDVKI